MAAGEHRGGGGGFHGGGGGFHGGGGGLTAAAAFMAAAAPFTGVAAGGGGGWHGGYAGGGGGYGNGYGYGYGGAALGLGLLGGAIIGSQYPYYGSGLATRPAMTVIRRTEVEIPRPTARAPSNRTIRRAGRISATTACGILARELTERSS